MTSTHILLADGWRNPDIVPFPVEEIPVDNNNILFLTVMIGILFLIFFLFKKFKHDSNNSNQ